MPGEGAPVIVELGELLAWLARAELRLAQLEQLLEVPTDERISFGGSGGF